MCWYSWPCRGLLRDGGGGRLDDPERTALRPDGHGPLNELLLHDHGAADGHDKGDNAIDPLGGLCPWPA